MMPSISPPSLSSQPIAAVRSATLGQPDRRAALLRREKGFERRASLGEG
jgi:hypothetical protein